MPAVPANAHSSTTSSSKPDGADYEPDDEWKAQLRKRIEDGLQSMVADAKENQAAESRKAPDTPETRMRLEADYKQAMQTIKSLASEQYQLELDRERNQRRWTAGVPMTPAWTQYFHEEQQNIMNSIKQSTNQTDNSIRTAGESPPEEHRSAIPKPSSNDPPARAPSPVLPVHSNPSVRPTEERENSFVSPQSVRRGSDARNVSRDRDEHPGSFRRGHHASLHERPGLPESWVATEMVEEPEELMRPPPPRARLSSMDRPSQSSPVSPDRWDSSLGRSSGSIHSAEHLARSPPRAPPEVWKPAISLAEDALPAKTYNLGRRGSAASMRSTGSGTSMRSTGSGANIRPSIKETIPERADDGPDEFAIEENDYERAQETAEQGRTRISTDKSREKERRPHLRRNSRQSPVDAGLRSDELFGSSGLRSASSSTMQYATLPPSNRPLSARPSMTFDERHHHPVDSPGKPPPYYDYRDQSSPRDMYPHREQQGPSQDQLPGRSFPPRSAYAGDERDYGTQYLTSPRPHLPKPPYHSQRESRTISRQTSFTRQPYVEVDEVDDERDMDRGGRGERQWDMDRDREYDRDRDRDGGRDIYSEPRRATYPYPAPRHLPYPNPSPRPGPQDHVHMSDVHDDRESVPGPSHGRYNYRGPPDDWEYQRPPESAHPGLSRQSSYVRPRDDPDRRFAGENDGYSRHYSSAGGGGIPIPRHTSSLEEPLTQPAWREWAAEGNRHPNYDHHQQARSPPNVESFSHRRFMQPPPSYQSSSPHEERHSFRNREIDSSHRGNSTITDEYDSNEDTDNDGDDNDDEEEEEEDDDDDDGSEDGIEAKRLRDLEAKRQKLEEDRREADDELRRTKLAIQQLAKEDARKRKEEEEVKRKEEEARKREEEAQRKEAEIRRMEEEVKKKEEEAAKKAEEATKMQVEAKKKEAEAKKKEKEARLKEQDAKRKEAAAKRTQEEARRKAEELSRKEEEAKQRAAQLEHDTEKTKQMQLQAQKFAEDLKKKEEEALKKDMEIKEREDILRRREEELMRREADNFRKEEETKKKEEEARQQEAARQEEARKKEELKKEEAKQKEEARREARRERARQEEETRKEETRKEQEARKKKIKWEEEVRIDEARKKEEAQRKEAEREEAKKKAAEAKKKEEDDKKQKLEAEEAKRKADEAAKRREEDLKREGARLEDFRREQEEKRLQNESQYLDDDVFFDLDSKRMDPKVMEEQLKVLQQAGFRKREEDIRRTREERKRNDSVGNDSAWQGPSYHSASPGTSPGVSWTPPQFNNGPIPERNPGPSTGGWGTGQASGWGPSIKPTAAATSSPAANRSSTSSTSTGKPRTGSVSSGTTHPASSSSHTASFSEAERTRKQQEFAESQQEQFRRAQERLEAERQLKSAGRPLSREESQRVFEHHERLWTRLNSLNELSWNDFPWPMAKQPSNPDDMSLSLIGAYIQSPLYPDKDKSRTPKDRIKEHIKRWHPDRFETKLLPKVVEDEREKVKHGAGNVARYLSDLLRKENESNNNNMFGD